MRKFISSAALAVCLLAPATTIYAHDDHHDAPAHRWNDSENATWHQYLKDHHKKDHDWEKAGKREQSAYWKWRDQHHDGK